MRFCLFHFTVRDNVTTRKLECVNCAISRRLGVTLRLYATCDLRLTTPSNTGNDAGCGRDTLLVNGLPDSLTRVSGTEKAGQLATN